MSKAREIAEERLARGEISEAEFDQLIDKIKKNVEFEREHAPEPVSRQASPASSGGSYWGWLLVPVVVGAVSLYIGSQRLNSDMDRRMSICLANNGTQARCSCANHHIKTELSAFDFAPVFGAFSDHTAESLEALIRDAAANCRLQYMPLRGR